MLLISLLLESFMPALRHSKLVPKLRLDHPVRLNIGFMCCRICIRRIWHKRLDVINGNEIYNGNSSNNSNETVYKAKFPKMKEIIAGNTKRWS